MGNVKRYRSRCYYLYVILFPNGKRYFGVTTNPRGRWLEHCKSARNGRSKAAVHEALRKHGLSFVAFTVLVKGSESYIKQLEIAAIVKFDSLVGCSGYNISTGGDISPMLVPGVAVKVSNTMRLKIATDPAYLQSLLDRFSDAQSFEKIAKRVASCRITLKAKGGVSVRTRAKMSIAHRDKKQSPGWIANKAASRVANGKKWSDEARQRASASQKLRFERERLIAEEAA